MKLYCLCTDILMQKHQHVCLPEALVIYLGRDMSFSGGVRDSSTVSTAGVLPSMQPSVLTLAMDFSLC